MCIGVVQSEEATACGLLLPQCSYGIVNSPSINILSNIMTMDTFDQKGIQVEMALPMDTFDQKLIQVEMALPYLVYISVTLP